MSGKGKVGLLARAVRPGGRRAAILMAMAATRGRGLASVPLTAAYVRGRDGWITAEILEARGVYTQGRTLGEARRNLVDAVRLMLEAAPHQFFVRRGTVPRGATTEKLFLLAPA